MVDRKCGQVVQMEGGMDELFGTYVVVNEKQVCHDDLAGQVYSTVVLCLTTTFALSPRPSVSCLGCLFELILRR